MAWTYSDWVTQTTAASKLTRLRLHIQEVSDRITESMSADGVSHNAADIRQYLDSLKRDEREMGAAGVGSSMVRGKARVS